MKILIGLLIILCTVSCASAFTVSSMTVDPSGDQAIGTPITVKYVIYPVLNGQTFPPNDNLQMSTDLINPKWTWNLVVDNVDHIQPSSSRSTLLLNGITLSYDKNISESIKVTLSGNISAAGKNLLKIQQLDSNDNIILDYKKVMPILIITTPITSQITYTPKSTTIAKKMTVNNTYTSYPTNTPTQGSPMNIWVILLAVCAIGLIKKH